MSIISPEKRFKLIPAVYLFLRQDDTVLLLRRANTGYQDGKYGAIAGHLEGDELATEGMVREAAEETGIIVAPQDMRLVHVAHRLNRGSSDNERIDLFFETTKWQGQPRNQEPKKCDDLSWHHVNQLPAQTIPLIKLTLAAIARGAFFSEYTEEPR